MIIKDAVKQILDKGITEETLYDFAIVTNLYFKEYNGKNGSKKELTTLFKEAFDEFENEEDEAMGKAIDKLFGGVKETLEEIIRPVKRNFNKRKPRK